MNIVLTAITYFFIMLLGILPFRVLYVFSDFVRFLLQHIFGYRKKVVVSNLRRCFPDLDNAEINKLTGDAYKNLMDVMVEGIKAFTMTKKQIVERHKILNPEILDILKDSKKNIIAAPCHYGNWEWGTMSSGLQFNNQIVGFYTPLSNPYLDKLIRKNRSRTGIYLTSTRNTTKTFDEREDTKSIFIMAADQSPSKPDRAIWVNFLGQKTAFLHGIEKHARLRNIPVLFVDIQRVKRGYYTLELSFLSKNPKETNPGEITTKYAKTLEKIIRQNPGNWLWSHNRWKLNKN